MAPVLLLHVVVDPADADVAAGRLWELGTTGVEERDDPDGVRLVAAFPTEAALRGVADRLSGAASEGTFGSVEIVEVADDGWRDEWRKHARPLDVGARLHLVPAWREARGPGGRVVVRIDPGPCFGTGSHPTTRVLLARLESLVHGGERVLDVGTGSGILAAAAACLGAAQVVAVDIDPESVPVTRGNAAANGVGDRIDVSTRSLADVEGAFGVVLANLSAATLADLAEPLRARVAPGGWLLLGGMLDGQWDHVADRFPDLVEDALDHEQGWTIAALRRPAGATIRA